VEKFDSGGRFFDQRFEKGLAHVRRQAGHAQVVGGAGFEAHAVAVAAAVENVGTGAGLGAVTVVYGCNQFRVTGAPTLQDGCIMGAADVAGQQRFGIGFDGDDDRD